MKIYKPVLKIILFSVFLLIILLYPNPYTQTTSLAQTCTTTTSRADGLVTSPLAGGTSKFGTSSGACIINNSKAAFTPYKIPTYEDLKSIYYTQAKAPIRKTQIAGSPSQGTYISTLNSNDVILVTGDLSDINFNVGTNKPTVIFIDGNLTIGNNITYGDSISGLVFIVKGDVNILSSVTRIDAIIISSGAICTAHDGINCPTANILTSPLVINGSLISIYKDGLQTDNCTLTPPVGVCPIIKFKRELANNNVASEQINHQVKYLIILRNILSETIQKWSEIDPSAIIPTPAPTPIFVPTPAPTPVPTPTPTSIPGSIILAGSRQSSSATWSQNCGNGANRMLIVTSGEWRASSTSQLNSLTYAGATLTKLGQTYNTSTGALVTMWYQIAPTSGTNNIIASVNTTEIAYGSSCWSGVTQVAPANLVSAFSSSQTPSITVPSTTSTDMVVDGLAILCATGANATPSSGQTPVLLANISSCNARIIHSSKIGSTGSTTMSWALSGSEFRWAQIGARLQQTTTPTSTPTPTPIPTPTPAPTPSPVPIAYNQTTDYATVQGNRGWYYYFTHVDNPGAPWAATYGYANTYQMIAWYGESSNNYWYDCYGCWGSVTPTRGTGGDSSIAVIYWKAPEKGLATMNLTQTKTDACNGNGYDIGLGYSASVGSWISQSGPSTFVGQCDLTTKTLTFTKQMNGNDALIYFNHAWRWTYYDMSSRTLTVSFTPN